MEACTPSTEGGRASGRRPQKVRFWDIRIDLVVILSLIVATTWVGYPLLKDLHLMQSLRRREASVEQLTRELRADSRFTHVGVSVFDCKHPAVVGEVDCGETYADLKKIILSCQRKKEIILNVRYPHLIPGEENPVVCADEETIAPGN